MKKTTKILGLAAALAAGTVGLAIAQTPQTPQTPPAAGSGMGPGMGPGMGMGMMGGGMMGSGMMGGGMGVAAATTPAARLAFLKTEIGITTAQQPAWDAYAKTLEEVYTSMGALHEGMATGGKQLTSEQWEAHFVQMRAQRDTAFQKVKTAADKLLPALDDAQKKKAMAVLPGAAVFGPGAMRGPGHMMH